MNADDDAPNSGESPGEATPLPYKYRYKYLHKYGDEGARGDGEQADDEDEDRPNKDHDDKDDDGKDDKDKNKDGDGDDKKEKDDKEKNQSPEEKRKQKRKKILILSIIALVFVLAALGWLLYYLLVLRFHESTDDAYVRGDMVTISSRVNGTVVEVGVEETEPVHAGEVLLRLDPVDAQVSLMDAEGQLAQAVRDAQQSIQQAAQADAAVLQRRAQYESQRADYERRHPLLEMRAVSKEEVDNQRHQTQASLAALQQAQAQAKAAHAQVDGTDVHDFPAVVRARSQFRNAWVNNGRNAIVSPIDGYAARRQVQVGQRVQPGQDLLTVVPLANLWVDANFKETQLENVRIGQPVEITTDMYSDVTYHGKVVGLNAGTGSAFSLLPAENATGNWIKVVQRLPVRVSFDAEELRKHPLRIGLSTDVDVSTHDRDGQVLSRTAPDKPYASTDVYGRELAEADQRAEAIIQANLTSANTVTTPAAPGKRGH